VPAQKSLHELLDICLSVSAVVAAEKMADAMVDAAIIKELKMALDLRLALIAAEAMTRKAAMMVEAICHLTREQSWISSSFAFLYVGFRPHDCK
jgi:hypothetical protein